MSDNYRKVYSKKGTGTVPKIKCANADAFKCDLLHGEEANLVSNNLGSDVHQSNHINYLGNSGKTQYYHGMEQTNDNENVSPNQNGNILHATCLGNDTSSCPISRRNSTDTVRKCDNITRYPDKTQIEDKLNQIREYLHITSTLMSNMKNSDDQCNDSERQQLDNMYGDLKDSEAKLNALLGDVDVYSKASNEIYEINEGEVNSVAEEASSHSKSIHEIKVEHANQQLEMLHEQENLLTILQAKAENYLRDARQVSIKFCSNENIFTENGSDLNFNQMTDGLQNADNKKPNQQIIKDLEDRINSLKVDSFTCRPSSNIQEQFQAQIESIQQKINQLKDSNDNRNQLIHILDKHDIQLQSEHTELQGKLKELQNKKMQVDQLVLRLQRMNDECENEDAGFQVRKILGMKEQLSKLKDMLETVKNSENLIEIENINDREVQVEPSISLSCKSDNVIQNDVRKSRSTYNDSSSVESNTRSSNERKIIEKQVNKKSLNANERERQKLQAELHAKKRELEELMCKHKAASSNLNQDVYCENKSDAGVTNHGLFEGAANSWCPMPSNLYPLPNSSEIYSSDDAAEDDVNEYSEINSSAETSNIQMVQPMAALNYHASNYTKHKSLQSPLQFRESYVRNPPDLNEHPVPAGSTRLLQREDVRSNSGRGVQNNSQVEKQLQLIKSVCDSMLEQQIMEKEVSSSTQSVRNNLTPSPLQSDARHFASPNSLSANTLNVVNPVHETTWVPQNQSNATLDTSGYQNWLTTNTLQTQAFMLNTLNQCCQMLWLQQRELASMRNIITTMQEKLVGIFDRNQPMPLYTTANTCVYSATIPPLESREGTHRDGFANTKISQVPSATSLPNLNHTHATLTTNTIEPTYLNQNNLHNARILESTLNNSVHHNAVDNHTNNTLLHSVNQSLPSQIWNGQALNNQVAPGNRANNYWDNFRSYSRQNLLSTKNNEGLQNQISHPERSNNSSEASFTFTASQKRNPRGELSTSSIPKRKAKATPAEAAIKTDSVTFPEVLNVNDIELQKSNSHNDLRGVPLQMQFDSFMNTLDDLDPSIHNSGSSESRDWKGCIATLLNPNESQNCTDNDPNSPKSKLFDELKENVYKEVASLISANQGRPHFLIQLFRDLQMVSSDPMRRKTLQSIQSLISNSLSSTSATGFRQTPTAQEMDISNSDLEAHSSYFVGTRNICNCQRHYANADGSDCPNYLGEVLTFLNNHNDDILQQELLDMLKRLLIDSIFSTVFINNHNSTVRKHFANSAIEAFEQFKGKRVQDVWMNILQTIEDLLISEIALIRLTRENISDGEDLSSLIMNDGSNQEINQNFSFGMSLQSPNCSKMSQDYSEAPQIQNGDLAEADQSRIEIQDDEEGAVGGVLDIHDKPNSHNNTTQISAGVVEQGLDEVPTRLTIYSTMQHNASNRGTSRTETSEQF